MTPCRFQSTHPMRGATRVVNRGNREQIISIHAPHAGCDGTTGTPAVRVTDFNPRTPCGVRRGTPFFLRRREKFQSTHPMRGATKKFFSTSRNARISIHAPHAGCDRAKRHLRARLCHFNPRTPCGVRQHHHGGRRGLRHFNPRTPCGA